MPKNESKTDQRDTQISTGCSNVRGRTRQSPAMQLSRPPVGWESSPSSAMSPQDRKGNHATTASRRQPRRSLPADEGASIPLHQFRPLSSPACPPTAPRMGQPPQKERGSPAILAGVADLPERRGNDATLLMLPPRGPREVARGGKPRGECLLQTSGRAERHTILAILGQSRAQTDLIRTRRERSIARSRSIGKHRGSGAIDPPLAISGVTRRRAVGHPTRCLVHHARGLLLPAREAGLPANGTSKPHGMSACAGLR